MELEIPETIVARVAAWDTLSRWEKAGLGRDLRRLGLSYGEIMELIPVPKGTLAGWCRNIRLTAAQVTAIKDRTGSVRGVPRNTQWRRREEIERIRAEARHEVPSLVREPLWLAGTVMYWAEGNKRHRDLAMTNTDPAVLRLFIAWVRRFLEPSPQLVLSLHLHAGNDEAAAQRFWRSELALPAVKFWKTYWKPPGTGHRNNRHPSGVCRVRVRRGTNALIRVLVWIEELEQITWNDGVGELLSFPPGR